MASTYLAGGQTRLGGGAEFAVQVFLVHLTSYICRLWERASCTPTNGGQLQGSTRKAYKLLTFGFSAVQILVEGKLKTDEWTDQATGTPRRSVRIRASQISTVRPYNASVSGRDSLTIGTSLNTLAGWLSADMHVTANQISTIRAYDAPVGAVDLQRLRACHVAKLDAQTAPMDLGGRVAKTERIVAGQLDRRRAATLHAPFVLRAAYQQVSATCSSRCCGTACSQARRFVNDWILGLPSSLRYDFVCVLLQQQQPQMQQQQSSS